MLASVQVVRLLTVVTGGWFGHLRYWTPLLHRDDHRNLASQALRYLLKESVIEAGSPVAGNRALIEEACGRLDVVEGESLGRVGGALDWEFSHFYDPIAGRGIDEDRFVNAFDEYRDLWERTLTHYRIGNLYKSFTFLGYCCHLLQDMAVPAHTHCVMHGLTNRTADNLELVSCSRRFYLRPPEPPRQHGHDDAHLELFLAVGRESRGREPDDPERRNDIADVLERYYTEPRWKRSGWQGTYIGKPYYPYHRFLPSSPRIRFADLVTLRNHLMCRAAERTAQLIEHFAASTSSAKAGTL